MPVLQEGEDQPPAPAPKAKDAPAAVSGREGVAGADHPRASARIHGRRLWRASAVWRGVLGEKVDVNWGEVGVGAVCLRFERWGASEHWESVPKSVLAVECHVSLSFGLFSWSSVAQ